MSEIDHPNIMKFIGIIMNPLGVVTEFLSGGDLKGVKFRVTHDVMLSCRRLYHVVAFDR